MAEKPAENPVVTVDVAKMQADLNNLAAENRMLHAQMLEQRIGALTAQIQVAELLRDRAQQDLAEITGK
jgi:hypothetical protein